jgi:uncharacterized membrane protein YphA (DoxX/SURF4 family)
MAPIPSRTASIATWLLQGVLAPVFLAAAGAKLAGVPMMVAVFDEIGFGQWFRYATALVEIAGAIVLLVPGLAAFAALWLAVTMCCAILAHLSVLHTSPAGAVVLLVLCVLVLWLRRAQIVGLRLRLPT